MATNVHAEEHHITSNKTYLIVWIALLILTGTTVYVSYINFGIFNIIIALAIASVKATIVALYFMHLKLEDSITWVFALFPLSLLALLIAMTMTDTFTRVVVP